MTDVMTKPHQLIASDRVEGTAVRRPNGDKIGHIERLMIDKISGKVSYAILSFGGFLGMGTNLLPLPWARLTYNPEVRSLRTRHRRRGAAARAVVPRRQGFRLGRSFAGSRAASLLRNTALLGRVLIARKRLPHAACRQLARAAQRIVPRNRSSRRLKICPATGTAGRRGGFSPYRISCQGELHMLAKYHDGRSGRFRVACDRCVRANSDRNHRSRQHGAGGRRVGFFVPGRLARLEAGRPQRL